MASPSNPFDEFDKPLQGRHAESAPANPFDEFDEAPEAAAITSAPSTQSVASRIANADPYVEHLISLGMPPERAMMYAEERGHPLEALKREVGEAGRGLKQLGSALVRPFVIGGESTLIPLDTAHTLNQFSEKGDYSPEALRHLILGFPDASAPSSQAQQWLDAHTQAPDSTAGRVAEMISSGLVGSKLPGMPASPKAAPRNPTLAERAIAAGEEHKVPVYYDDVTRSAYAKKLGTASENIPIVGTSAGRAKQANAAQAAAQKVAEKFDVNELGDDVPTLIQKGLQDKLKTFRTLAKHHYDTASDLLDPAGYVDTPAFNEAISLEMQAQAKKGSLANPKVVELLQKFKDAPGGNFTAMRAMRSDLKDAISDFYNGGENKAIGQKGVERLVDMRNGLEADMEAFAKRQGGDAYDRWKEANRYYKENLVPFKQQGFADLVKTAEPEKAWRYLMTQGGIESRAERMYNGLTEEGRAAVRAGAVRDAMEAATGPKDTFSPARFAKYMEDHENVINQFFKGEDKQQISGFTNLMRHVERAGQYMENPPTGNRVIAAAMLGGGSYYLQSLKPLLIAASTAGGTRILFQTKHGRDLLLAASKLKPGSPAMNVLGNRLGRMALGASMAPKVNPNQEQEQPDNAVSQ